MNGCKTCPAYGECTVTYRGPFCAVLRRTYGLDDDPEIVTNADRIRAMSDDELAELFHGFCDNGERCVYCPLYEKSCAGVHSDVPKWLEWLQLPVEGE